MSDRLRVTEADSLLIFLSAKLQGWSKKKIKQRLQGGCVVVNGESVVKHDHALNVGDNVEVLAPGKRFVTSKSTQANLQLEILFRDRDLIVINKPAGLLSVATAQESKLHALAILRNQLSHGGQAVKLWPVHRLDRDTSGVLMFATSREMREAVNAKWSEAEKVYLAVVEGVPEPDRGTINQPLRLDSKQYKMHVGAHAEAKDAITHYSTKRTVNQRSLLEVNLETGRQHQIRAHLSWLGCPVVGDPRYGTAGLKMGLHALRLTITRPKTGERLTCEAPTPTDLITLLR
ncbi:MAG: RluA family pseudouridine synthase [Algicola sp.]|nr:RluA family pseudouridine synthase [Algicola sp.]